MQPVNAERAAVNYTFDNANRLTQTTQGTSTVSLGYDNANRRTSLTLPNGVVVSYSYDTASQLTAMSYQIGSTTLGNLTYAYDLAGRRNSMGGSSASTNLPLGVSTTAYNANNELTQWGTATLTYDLNGNMTSSGTDGYTWDARNRLVSTLSGASFQYDASGRRASKTIGGAATSYLYDGVNVVQEVVAGTPSANLLVGGIDEVFTRTDSAGARSFLPDALGSTLGLTDSTGMLQTQYTYEPFGNTSVSGSTNANPYQYTGRENDGTGLYFYRARYYNPTFQRFASEDPIGFAGGINLYAYAGDSPTKYRDPSGLCTDPGGSGTRYCIDTFIPRPSAWGFTGDNRGPDPNGGTYRTQQTIIINPDDSIDESHEPGISRFGPAWRRAVMGPCGATPVAGRYSGIGGFLAHCWASDGLLLGAAPNAGYSLTLVETANGVYVSGLASSFPSLEIWQYGGPDGPKLIYQYDAKAAGTGPSNISSLKPISQ